MGDATGGHPLVRLEQVGKRFGDTRAVDGVSLDIATGEFCALLGPSGCGKTTLMRLIAGFEAADEGRVLIDGRDMAGVPAHRRPVNMMFQSYALFPHLDVAANIGFGLVQAGLPKREIAARVAEMLKLVQLEGFGKRKPDQLSGGQRQRVALARALARRPKLLLLDEPLGALDRKLREDTQFELIRIQRELGTAFVLVTHDQDEAMVMASRIAVMRAGRIEQIGTPRAIYDMPETRFVAGFVGEINLIEARVAAVQGTTVAAVTTAGIQVSGTSAEPVAPGDAIALAIRPERMATVPAGRGFFEGRVLDTTFRGGSLMQRIDAGGGPVLRIVRSAGATVPGQGDIVGLVWRVEDARVLVR